MLIRANEDEAGLVELAEPGLGAGQNGERHARGAGSMLEFRTFRFARPEHQERKSLAEMVE